MSRGESAAQAPAADHVKGLTEFGFSALDIAAIDRDNAVRLMPRLKA
jgi:hypothetical protein